MLRRNDASQKQEPPQISRPSLRIRALMQAAKQATAENRPVGPDHPINQLERQLAQMEPERKSSHDGSWSASVRALTDLDYCRGAEYQRKQTLARSRGCNWALVRFSERLIDGIKAQLNIPLVAVLYGDSSVIIEHCKYGKDLTESEWAVIGHFGNELIHRDGSSVWWGGSLEEPVPDVWYIGD